MEETVTKHKLNSLKCCVIVPTYNNEKTLERVLNGVLNHTENLIIVNDGSTDSTAHILKAYTSHEQIHFTENKGKGKALRAAFKHAESLGYHYALTIDSDGQHFPEDIPIFINTLEASEDKNLLLIGARNMDQDSVPKKSSFGNKFSNFWFWAETGIKLQDTQSGFRLYPIEQLKKLKFFTSKFEFEIEVIVKAAWQDISVRNIPIQVLYDETERVSHFRPFKDFTRISILNTWLVILTLLYIKPRNVFRALKKKGFKRFIVENFLGINDSAEKKALSVALGVFIGLTPLWGFHTVIVIFLALTFKLNKTIAFISSNVSMPPLIPFVIYGSFKIGNFVLGENVTFNFTDNATSSDILNHLKIYIVGSLSLAVISSVVLGLLCYFIFLLFAKKKGTEAHG